MYLNDGNLYKTPSDDIGEEKVVVVDFEEFDTLIKKSAELHSLKMSINESPLKNLFPHKDMSFHDKVLFAIHKLAERDKVIQSLEELVKAADELICYAAHTPVNIFDSDKYSDLLQNYNALKTKK